VDKNMRYWTKIFKCG